jgi:UDP-GlcNAc:undecaprenyl-phosphate GlcNAc-1-phosphate transferase
VRDLLSVLVSLAVTAALLYGLRPLAARIGLVDVPGPRKTHSGEVPLIGGLAMFVGFALGALTLDAALAELRAFFAACAVLVIVGVLDDLHELSSRARFAAQILAAAMMVGWGGVVLQDLGRLGPGGALFELGPWAVPFSVFCAVGVINALNMIDGADGLAAGVSLVALIGLALIAQLAGMAAERDVLSLLCAVVAAFIWLNARLPWRPRALVYMGDAGSMFLGFAITWFVIHMSQGPRPPMAPVTALWLLMVPLFDTVWLLFRRPLVGRWPTAASHDHVHHLLQMARLRTGVAVSVLVGVAALGAIAGVLAHAARVPERHMFWAFLALFAAYCVFMALSWRRGTFLGRPLERRLLGGERRSEERRGEGDRRGGRDRRRCGDRRQGPPPASG